MRKEHAMIAAFALLLAGPASAGPCTGEIHDLQLALNAKLDALAARGRTAPQSTAATLHRQPTPDSLASAEAKAGDISEGDVAKIREFIAQARKADDANNPAACHKALGDARSALKM